MKFNLILLGMLFIACDGKRHIDSEDREIKLQPEIARQKVELMKTCKQQDPDVVVSATSIMSQNFMQSRQISLKLLNLCEIQNSADPCHYQCQSPGLEVHLKDQNNIQEQFFDNDVNIEVSCEKYKGSECISFFLTTSIKKQASQKVVNFRLEQLGLYTYAGSIGEDVLSYNTGEFWKLHLLGKGKNHFMISDMKPKSLPIYNMLVFRKNIETGSELISTYANLYMPAKINGNELLDLKELKLSGKIENLNDNKLKMKRKIKALESDKTYDLNLNVEFNFHD